VPASIQYVADRLEVIDSGHDCIGGDSVKVQRLMTAPAVSVKADTRLTDIIYLINSHRIHHIPVLDQNEHVIGVLRVDDLLPKAQKLRSPDVLIPVLFRQVVDYKHIFHSYRQCAYITARDIMSPSPECADVDDDLDQVLRLMIENKLPAIPVLREGKFAGVFTSSDFIRILAQEL
jgi:CBS domain-containing protein